MPPQIIQLGKKDDLTSAIKQIKLLKDDEVIFEIEKGSPLLKNAEGLKLMKKTAEALGKVVKIETEDTDGRLFAQKAGVLAGEVTLAPKVVKRPLRMTRGDVKPPAGNFSDIMVPRRKVVKRTNPVAVPSAPVEVNRAKNFTPVRVKQPSVVRSITPSEPEGSRLEFEVNKSSSRFSKIFILCLVVLVVTVFGLAVLLPQADVTIFARSEPITRDFEISVDKAAPRVDTNSLTVPGIAVSREISQTKSFPTTGSLASGNKSTGTVTLYNFTSNTLTLRASTTTLIANGKNYSFTRDVTGIKPNGSPNTGIPIIAQNGGADYNLPANTRFRIVNAALGNQNVYAENPAALSGGTTGAATKVLSQQDIDNATNELLAAVVAAVEEDMTGTNSVKTRVLDSGVKKEVLAKTANKQVGQETEEFDMTLIAKVTGLAFREDDVIDVIVAKINEVLSSDKYLLVAPEPKYESNFKSIDSALSKGVLAVHFETVAAYKVDEENLPKILAGKNDSEIKEILLSKPEVDNVEVKFWPEWFVHKAPKFNGKIKIQTILSESN